MNDCARDVSPSGRLREQGDQVNGPRRRMGEQIARGHSCDQHDSLLEYGGLRCFVCHGGDKLCEIKRCSVALCMICTSSRNSHQNPSLLKVKKERKKWIL